MHVARKQRVETYLDPDTVATLENDYNGDVSALIRGAVEDMLEADDE